MNNKVLLVDDEQNILDAYTRTLRKRFRITTALSGADALNVVEEHGPFAVVVSDMRMPNMDGVEFLSKLRKNVPETVRVMLTGNSDQQTAVDAVNKGDIFRFLNKPCPPESMATTLNSAVEQYRLINAEKDLLENTVRGSIATLTEVLSLSKPYVFGRTTRYKDQMLACAKVLDVTVDWQMETTALLSLIGTVTLPDNLVERALSGGDLTEEEKKKFHEHPKHGAELIGRIPRLEILAEAIEYQLKNYDGSGYPEDKVKGDAIPLNARMLRVIGAYDKLEQSGLEKNAAIAKLKGLAELDRKIVSAFCQHLESDSGPKVKEVHIHQITEHMVLVSDVVTRDGTLLVCKGQTLGPSVSRRLINFMENDAIDEKILVIEITPEEPSQRN